MMMVGEGVCNMMTTSLFFVINHPLKIYLKLQILETFCKEEK